ncbi:hypothetical protein BCR32DRAFT_297712 [Anaeromyces robustus]|uniref:RPA-interacting protein C-terminal domain-containing protein n=1 Tax=Anaeromyces robustus TaxID=1754192 RepID=A0A1Y1VVZ5_9FUNG|nr:hypothetical protein BCR32DRAFT_297712 [Anaeromyces robustus]|eukprot:ORX65462.1 hypothetical protein BCR32DRAFT_297712 [Anaeromyces robustus]
MQQIIRGNNKKNRKPIKTILRRDDIHKKFQQQCLSRIRKDREKKIWEKRNLNIENMKDEEMEEDIDFEKILKEEWNKFKSTYEYYGELSQEEIEKIEIEMKNETDIIDNEYMELLYYEEQMLENTIESYQNEDKILTCPVCENGKLFENSQLELIKCSNCNFEMSNKQYNLENLGNRIEELQRNHSNTCNGDLVYSYQPEIGLFGVCMVCCGMEIV